MIIDKLSSTYPVHFLCAFLHIKRSGFYAWRKRKGSRNRHEIFRDSLLPQIVRVHKKHPSYGYHDIASVIRKQSEYIFSDNLIHKICKQEGIKSKVKHYQKKREPKEKRIYENLIQGNWRTERPVQKLVSDMTVLKVGNKNYEWCYVMDIYNHAIIASSISDRRGDTRIYHDCMKQVLDEIKKKGYTHPIYYHTDQGSVYTSRAHYEAHKEYTILRSMSRAGTPTDNAVIEAMNGWIKAEIKVDYNVGEWKSIDAFIKWYVHYYNHERPMSVLGYMSPVEYTKANGYTCSI